jgi:hypothetical protein
VAPVTSHKTVLYQAVYKSESCSAKSISCSWVGLDVVSHEVPLLQQLQVKQLHDIMTCKFKTQKLIFFFHVPAMLLHLDIIKAVVYESTN